MKKVETYKRWKIYTESDENGYVTYYGFLPGQSPRNYDSAEWEDGTIETLKQFIDSYGSENKKGRKCTACKEVIKDGLYRYCPYCGEELTRE